MIKRFWRTLLFTALSAFSWGMKTAAAQGALAQEAQIQAQLQTEPEFKIGYLADKELKAPLLVKFKATQPAEYTIRWVFGDGTIATGSQVNHIFYRPGMYTLEGQLLDAQGKIIRRATSKIEVKDNGPERPLLTVLIGAQTVYLSGVGSILYSATPVTLWLDGREVPAQKAIKLAAGNHQAIARGASLSGKPLERRLSFKTDSFSQSVPFEAEVLRLTNKARAEGWNCNNLKIGGSALPPLKPHPILDIAALGQSAGMALNNYFNHVSALDGSQPMQRVQATGLNPQSVAENIAAGQETPAEVVDGWLRSHGHCVNIMGNFQFIGLSYVQKADTEYKRYWTQVFARF